MVGEGENESVNTYRILIVDDDREIADLIEIYLRNDGYETVKAYDGEEALRLLSEAETPIHLVTLDVMMPKLDGMAVCRAVRERGNVPILMISAKAEDTDKVLGLLTGADDYLVKPFNPLELSARVKSLLRRAYRMQTDAAPEGEGVIRIGSLKINKLTHRAEVDGRPMKLTGTEFGILHLLASNRGRVFSAEEIFRHVWKEKYFDSNNTVMVHISHLRDKLEQETGDKMITTVWGVGYKIEG